MQRRALFSLINLCVAAGALLVFFLFPRYAGYAIYAFLGWFLVGISTVWLLGNPSAEPSRGPTPAPAGAGGAGPAAAPLRSSTGGAGTSAEVGFCIYCAADLPPGASRCPACGHAGARLG